jgi:hypothetical protein
MKIMNEPIEVTSDEIKNAWLSKKTEDATYLCVFNQNMGMDCPFLSKTLGVKFTESDDIEISLIKFESEAMASFHYEAIRKGSSHLSVEVWSKGKKILGQL